MSRRVERNGGDRMAEVKALMLDDLDGVLEAIGIRGRRRGRAISACSPLRPEKNPSFTIWTQGVAKGGWKDFGSGESGDIVDLVALTLGGGSRSGALRWGLDRYGLRRMDEGERQALRTASRERRETAEREAAARDAENRKRAIATIKRCGECTPGDAADRYLAMRGCRLFDVPHLEPKTYRFDPAHVYWETDLPHPRFPALLAAMRDGEGRLQAVHRTFVRADAAGKAPVAKPKLIWPRCGGATIRISRGPSNLGCEEAAAAGVKGPMAISEGNEDGLTYAIAGPEFRVHAAGSLSGLMSFPDFACADAYVVLQDNDWGKPQAGAQFAAALRRLASFGKPVLPVRSPVGKDFNDLVRSA